MAAAKLKEKDIFENMPVRKAVLTLAVPTVISQLIVLIYNLADTWFIGQTGDPLQVAAVTVSYPLFMLLSGFGNLFGIGGGSLISRLLGRGEPGNAGKIGTFVIKGIFDLPLMMLANVLWPMYGLMLVGPVMEFLGGSLAVFLYQRQAHTESKITI